MCLHGCRKQKYIYVFIDYWGNLVPQVPDTDVAYFSNGTLNVTVTYPSYGIVHSSLNTTVANSPYINITVRSILKKGVVITFYPGTYLFSLLCAS